MCSVAHKWGPVDRALAGPGSSLPLHSGRTFLRIPRFGRGRFNERSRRDSCDAVSRFRYCSNSFLFCLCSKVPSTRDAATHDIRCERNLRPLIPVLGSPRIVCGARKVYVTVWSPSVCQSVLPFVCLSYHGAQQQTRCCRFAAVGPASRRY